MVHALRIGPNSVTYQNRFVVSEGKAIEDAAQRRLFAEFGTGPAGGAIGRWRNRGRGKNTGNTNIIQHGGRLLALMEVGGRTASTRTRWKRSAKRISTAYCRPALCSPPIPKRLAPSAPV